MTTGEGRGGFRAVFGAGHVVLPVIHAASQQQALRNVQIARDAAA